MAKMSYQSKKNLPDSAFAIVKKVKGKSGKALKIRKYPIHDKPHARNAKARVAAHGTPAEKSIVNKKVKAKFPAIGKPKKKKGRK